MDATRVQYRIAIGLESRFSMEKLCAAALTVAAAALTVAAAALTVAAAAPTATLDPARVQLHRGPIEFGRRRIANVPQGARGDRSGARLRRSGPQREPSRQRRFLFQRVLLRRDWHEQHRP